MSGRSSTPGGDSLVGKILGGKYVVEGLLARGGMGRVYRGVQEPLGRSVAVKVFEPQSFDEERNRQFEKRFFLEASVCARLTHPNILTIYDYGSLDDVPGVYIVMELLEGRSLRQVLKEEGALEEARALHIARQVCGALIEAHDEGLVHRDLKPGNVVLVSRGGDPDFVKVVDFGLVKQLASGESDVEVLTTDGQFVGTPRYMAPEQIHGGAIDQRTDIYAFGVMLYECLAGVPPFRSRRKGELPLDLLTAHLSAPPPPLRSHALAKHVSPEVEAVVFRCLQKRPEHRFPSMREVLVALGGEPVPNPTARRAAPPRSDARGASLLEAIGEGDDARTVAGAEEVTRSTVAIRPPKERAARRAAVVAVGVTAALGGISLAVLLLALQGEGDDEAPPVDPPGAAVKPAPEPTVLVLRSSPEGATVKRGDAVLGTTPFELSLEASEVTAERPLSLTFAREGHIAETVTLAALEPGERIVEVTLKPAPAPKQTPPVERRKKKSKRTKRSAPNLDIKVER